MIRMELTGRSTPKVSLIRMNSGVVRRDDRLASGSPRGRQQAVDLRPREAVAPRPRRAVALRPRQTVALGPQQAVDLPPGLPELPALVLHQGVRLLIAVDDGGREEDRDLGAPAGEPPLPP